jgi:anti-sigma factor RsiW
MINCERIRRLVSEYVDGRLRPRHQRAVEAHLEACEPCRVAIRETRMLAGWLRESLPPLPSPVVWDNVLAQIRAEAAAPPRPMPQLRRWQRATGWATAAAAAALALLAPLRIQTWRDNGPANTRHVIGWHANYAARWPLADQGQMRVVAMRVKLTDLD